MNKHFAVRERNVDIVFFENIPDGQHYIAAHIGNPFLGILDPETTNEVQAAITEFFQVADWLLILTDAVDLFDGFDHHFLMACGSLL